ncbi:N-acetylmuramoyl-L-alanine amidase [Lysobacter sp. F60174L2]|uniref:N-acetylmuramoyl-L-alanine amidase n=1 Tax=Lysobacter sp. F60174L2 TaxID=3459295 RepID=UPI00403DF7DD
MSRFLRVGQAITSPASNTTRKVIPVPIYVDEHGYVQNAGFVFQPIPALEHGRLQGPHAIVLHRTVSSTARNSLNAFARGIGTHFLIDKDGTIYQTASLLQKTYHVGPIRSRCFEEGTCDAAEQAAVESLERRQGYRDVHNREKVKPYPDRFPMNEGSVGIEVVAMYTEATRQWDPPTPEQSESITLLARILKTQYSLTDADIYEHDRISRKTAGEGAGLYDGSDSVPARFPPPFF